MALTFVNQVGAVEGMNQAAPGTLIPESFVRWSQDVLFDRAGLMRRRGPFEKFDVYQETSPNVRVLFDPTSSSTSDERVLGTFSTYTPTGKARIGMLVHISPVGANPSAVFRVFDDYFTYLGEETLPFTPNVLSIVSAKPALGGGLWVSISEDPADAKTHYQFFWRGGVGAITGRTGTFTTEGVQGFSNEHGGLNTTITLNNSTSISEGQFVYATISTNDYYVGTVKSIGTSGNTIMLDKRPFIWETGIDNNHIVEYTVTGASWSSGTATLTVNTTVLFEVGDMVTISGITPSGYNPAGNTAVLTAVSGNTLSYAIASNPGSYSSGGVVEMDNDLLELDKTDVALKFVSVRPFEHMHGRGLLIIDDGDATVIKSGTAGTSADGHWQAAAVAGYNLYRASDNAYLGKVKDTLNEASPAVASNTTGHLVADPGAVLNGEEYVMRLTAPTNLTNAFKVDSRNALTFAGLYTAVYAGYQWYGNFGKDDQNTNRVVFSAAHEREAVDLSRDAADSIIFPGKSKFRGLGSSSAGLLVFLEDRTYILRGNDRTNFSVEQLVPEGCLCPTSIVEYGGGVFWAGKSGIMFFDGATVRNLTKDNLGLYYTDALDEFNPEQDRVIGFMHKNNLIMHYTSWKSPFDPIRYEPIYVDDWFSTDGISDKTWEDFDEDFDYDDFFTDNNTPIFWDQRKLNNPEESASTGKTITWGSGVYAKEVSGSTVPTTFTANYIYMPALAAAVRFKKWNGSSYTTVAPVVASGTTPATKLYVYTGTGYTAASIVTWDGSTWTSTGATTGILWGSGSSLNKWGPLRLNTSITFCVYTPTGSVTTLSNMDFRGVTAAETTYGLKTILGVNSIEASKYRARFIDIHPVFDTNTNGADELIVEKINIPTVDLVRGPDFYLQTKHFTVGDPILRKWFQKIMLSMLLYDGAIRMDLVDDDDNDAVDINKKKHKYWEIFTEKGYDWSYLTDIQFPKIVSPNRANWQNVESTLSYWDELFTADFNRYSKRISWRKPSVGFRLYQLNEYKKPFNGVVTVPNRVELQGFSIGFKPLRQGRV